MIVLHLILLHNVTSSTSLGSGQGITFLPFSPYYLFHDLHFFFIIVLLLLLQVYFNFLSLLEISTYIPANSLVTPIHIKPE